MINRSLTLNAGYRYPVNNMIEIMGVINYHF